MLRYGLLALALAAISAAIAWLSQERPGAAIKPYSKVEHAVTAAQAAADQQGVPTTFAETSTRIALAMAQARAAVAAQPQDAAAMTAMADVLAARARLTNSFDDYAAAGQYYDKAFALSPRSGPDFQRATLNFTVHRLAAVPADLARIDAYAVTDAGTKASTDGIRGDLAFYSGRYKEALDLYEGSHGVTVTVGTAFRLANYWMRMGDPAKADAYLDEAESRIRGPQQQQRAYIETTRGIVDFGVGKWDEAGLHFARANAIFPGFWQIEEHLATILALKGDATRAMRLYRNIAVRTGMPEAYDAVAGLYRAQAELAPSRAAAAKAGALWAERLAILPEATYGHLLDHELAFGDPRQALAVAQRNFANRPFGESATGLAWAYMANHRPADAIRAIEPTLASGWTVAEAYIVATEAYALAGQPAKADAARKKALEINPHSFDRNPGVVWLDH